MARSQKLQQYCNEQGITLEKCPQRGRYLLSMAQRPDAQTFGQLQRDINEIGYTYLQDGQDKDGYFFTIKPQEPAFQSSGDDVIDDMVNDLEMDLGYSICSSIFAL